MLVQVVVTSALLYEWGGAVDLSCMYCVIGLLSRGQHVLSTFIAQHHWAVNFIQSWCTSLLSGFQGWGSWFKGHRLLRVLWCLLIPLQQKHLQHYLIYWSLTTLPYPPTPWCLLPSKKKSNLHKLQLMCGQYCFDFNQTEATQTLDNLYCSKFNLTRTKAETEYSYLILS